GIVGLEAAIVLIAFVIIAAAFSFMVVNQGLFATERGKTVIQEGLKQASTPLTMDGSTFVRTMEGGDGVDVIVIPVRAFGVKYVAMWKNETVVSLKVGKSAWANVYGGVLYAYSDYDVTGEVVGTGDDTETDFNLDHFPIVTDSETIYLDGVVQVEGALNDYTIVPATGVITFVVAPGAGVIITADYTWTENVGTGDAAETVFNLDHFPVVEGTETIYFDGVAQLKDGSVYIIDYATGMITFGAPPAALVVITADYTWADGETFDPSGYKFDDIVGLKYDPRSGLYYNGAYSSGAGKTAAVLALENSNGDESLDSFEKGYLIITLASEDAAKVRAAITIEVRLEKTAPLSIEFNIPEAMPKDTWVLT
ncbi:hypothetical protein KKF61_08915, partial [Patescibacteria group bacterium]|nr:hypothetical protein [Patescibacteria group bacterium]